MYSFKDRNIFLLVASITVKSILFFLMSASSSRNLHCTQL